MNNLILEEINRFREILNYKNLLSESIISGAYDNIIKKIIKQKLDDVIKSATRESLERVTKLGGNLQDNLFSLVKSDGKPFDINKLTNEIKESLKNTPGVKVDAKDTDFLIKQKITTTLNSEKETFIKNAKDKLSYSAPDAKKITPTNNTPGQRPQNISTPNPARESGKNITVPGKNTPGQPFNVGDGRKIQKPDLNIVEKELAQSQSKQIKDELKDDIAELSQAATDPSKLKNPTIKEKIVNFAKKAKLVNANGKISKIGIATMVILGLGTFGVIGALSESGITPEDEIIPQGGGDSSGGGGSGVTGWRSLGKQYDDQIKTALGLPTDTQLTDADIDTLYNKLKENGKI